MGLGSQFFQGHFGLLQSLALGAKGRIAQARAAVKTLAPPTGRCAIAARKAIAATSASGRPSAVTLVTPFEPPAHRRRLGFFHAGSVVAAHRHHGFGGTHRRGWHGWLNWRCCACIG